jgi:threonine synthase
MQAICYNCGKSRKGIENTCSICGSFFTLKPDFKFRTSIRENYPYISDVISLGEVATPILNLDEFSLKLDYFSPTFSYKDRGSRILVSYLKGALPGRGITNINEDSSGNAGSSMAAYGRKAGFNVNIFVPEKTMESKVNQIRSYGANIVMVRGSREDVQKEAEKAPGFYASHVLNPEFRDGIRTLAYEIFMQSEHMPERIFVPVSAGTLLLGLVSGLEHLMESGEIERVPEIVAVQTELVSPLYSAVEKLPFIDQPDKVSIADALVSKKPLLMQPMIEAVEKYGKCITVSDPEIIKARNDLALSGVYAEYSSATVLAAFRKLKGNKKSLLVLTGNGLKTP